MGVTAHFYEKAIPVKHSEAYPFDEDECWDSHLVAWTRDFPEQADGIEQKSCWVTEGEFFDTQNSYGGYNQYRAWLCMAALNCPPETVWENPAAFRDKPFYFQINFADNEGVIGPKTSRILADDYREQRDYVIEHMREMPRPFDCPKTVHDTLIDRMIAKYEDYAKGFEIAADTGLVSYS